MRYFFLCLTFFLCMITSCLQAQNKSIDVQQYLFQISLNDSNNIIQGKASISFLIKKPGDVIYFDLVSVNDSTGKGMKVSNVQSAGKDLKFKQDSDRVNIYFNKTLPVHSQQHVIIYYAGVPADGLIIDSNKFGHRTFFADNWPNRAHNWIPCNDHPSDKASVEFIVIAPDHYQVISNGILVEESNLVNHLKLTHWKENLLLPTKVMVIGVANFAVQYLPLINGIPVSSWVFPENRDSGFIQYSIEKNILPFFINYIGPYPYKKLANVQSKTIFGGMENASNIFYYENSVNIDSVMPNINNPVEGLVAHETAHQWFGDEASETDWQHVWLSEGFATYMTHLYFENRYGEDTLKKRLALDRKKVIQFYKKRKTPVVDTSVKKNLLQLLNANSYEKGSWVLHMLRRKLGDAIFQNGIRTYYAAYMGKNASTDDFKKIMESASKQNLDIFFKQWLYMPGQPVLQVKWTYDLSKKEINISVTQQQNFIFQFPLQILITGGKDFVLKTFEINNRTVNIHVPLAFTPLAIQPDPNVNLLFEGKVEEEK